MNVLLGKPVASVLRDEIVLMVDKVVRDRGNPPKLVVIQPNNDPSSSWYVNSIKRAGTRVGIKVEVIGESSSMSFSDINAAILDSASDEAVDGIILQTPIDAPGAELVVNLIPPQKDVDCASATSLGMLMRSGHFSFAPATAEAVIRILDHYQIEIAGKTVLVIGRSLVVGRPVAQLFLNRDATVTCAHSRTRGLDAIATQSDIIVSATGSPGIVDSEMVSSNSVVIDVGTFVDSSGNLQGDVSFSDLVDVVAGVTPVPGGVGAVTTQLLLRNVARAASDIFQETR